MRLFPSDRTSNRRPYPSAETGFTLIELLVVVFIIALISGFAVLSVSVADSDRKLEQEVQRAGQLFSLAVQEAIVQGRPMGVRFTERSYRFLIAGRESWESPGDAGTFRPRSVPPEWRLELVRDGKRLPLSTEEPATQTEDPQLLFYPSGEVVPLQLIWRDREGRARQGLVISVSGGVAISTAEEML